MLSALVVLTPVCLESEPDDIMFAAFAAGGVGAIDANVTEIFFRLANEFVEILALEDFDDEAAAALQELASNV